ncbi:MAG: phage virion morphogenesis protein [Spirulina sp.]
MVSIRVDVEKTALDGKLQRAVAKLTSLDAMLTEFGEMGEAAAKQSFPSGATPGGAAWASLRPSTLRRKSSGRLMWETGALAASFLDKPPSGNAVEVCSEGVPYATYHHTGTRKMAQRRSLPLPSYLRPKMAVIAKRHLATLL